MDRKKPQFHDFIDALQDIAQLRENAVLRHAFRSQWAVELSLMALMLNDLGVTGGTSTDHLDPPEHCDLCGNELIHVAFFVDGATKPGAGYDGAWSNMCPDCYWKVGAGIGWGTGQLYRNRGRGRWQCIAGADPSVAEG